MFEAQLSPSEALALQLEELEALRCIYPDLLAVEAETPAHVAFNMTPQSALETCSPRPPASWIDNIRIHFDLQQLYPQSPAIVSLETRDALSMMDFCSRQRKSLLRRLNASAREGAGGPALFSIIAASQEWLSSAEWNVDGSTAATSADDDDEEDSGDCAINSSGQRKNPINHSVQLEQAGDEVEIALESERIRTAIDAAAAYCSSSNSYSSNGSGYGLKGGGGVWNFVVGLIGKPSAGKSTFFNAVTRSLLVDERKLAAVAAHPFTTIDPNISQGFFSSRDDDDDRVHARHGRSAGRRLLLLLVKDVAGLVPGAYKGKGKGNKFLNDLCEADVLVHIIDATGNSDESGNIFASSEKECGDPNPDPNPAPLRDHGWIQEELHRWVAGNVRGKWQSVSRMRKVHPSDAGAGAKASARVKELFTGYQGGRVGSLVAAAAARAGLDLEAAERWDSSQLHALVAHYLRLRFPICLALNKIDAFADSEEGAEVVRRSAEGASRRGEVAVPVSALCESLELERTKRRQEGGAEGAAAAGDAALDLMQARVRMRFPHFSHCSFGVMESVSAAVYLKSPVLVYPVQDLGTEAPVGWGDAQHGDVPALRDCLLMRPGSSVYELYEALKRGALDGVRLQGDFVRAEGRGLAAGGKRTQLSKDSVVDHSNCVIRIYTNRKAVAVPL